jgi:RHS repeat-associated protein
MSRCLNHTQALCALIIVALTACDERSAFNGRPSIRLSPREVQATGVVDTAALIDRDTSAFVSVDHPTSVKMQFGHSIEARRFKVHGARALRVTIGDTQVEADDLEEWSAFNLAPFVTGQEVVVSLEPTSPGAGLREIEVWGAGRDVAPQNVHALARVTQSPSAPEHENVWTLRGSPADATLQPSGTGEGSSCVRTTFPAANPRQAQRAYLVYEANVRRAVTLQRSFGGEAPQNGFWLGATSDVRTVIDEIDPERLRGADELLLCIPADAGAPVTVKGLRLVVLLDDGTDPFDRDTVRRLGAALDGDASTTAGVARGPTHVGLDRAIDLETADLRLGHVPARLDGLALFDGSSWHEQSGVDVTEPTTRLPLSGRATALRLDFAGPARTDVPAASVAELSAIGSGVGPRVGAPRIVLAYPRTTLQGNVEIGERFGSKAYVSGWAESPVGRGTVEIDGAPVDADGAFSLPLERPTGATGGWSVTLRARFPDGSEATRTIQFDDDREAELLGTESASAGTGSLAERFGRENQTAYGRFDPALGGKVALGTDVTIEAPPGAVSAKTTIGITRKGPELLPPLDAGMINVTAPAHAAYRFSPKGQKFAQAVTVKIPYDPDLLPEGVAPEEVQTYYFDEAKERWFALPRRQVLRGSRQIVSETTHFTFMINAVLVLPDHPGPVSFDPTSIKDLKAADPSAGIDLIEPPQANNEGTARLSFPIRVAKARGAYQPSLTIAYDSGGGNGWLGVGWDLAVPRVQIDTRYGVPEYTGEERYLIDGQAIVPIDGPQSGVSPSPTRCLDGSDAREYRARVERDFRRILRCGGSDPSRFWFEVTDKAGTLFVYGRSENARLASYIPRVTAVPVFPPVYDVAEWYLERVVDANGNLTQFTYQHDSSGAQADVHRESFRQVYLRAIQYAGWVAPGGDGRRNATTLEGGTTGPYLVELRHESGTRGDVITSARAGFKTVMRRRLGAIEVRLLSGASAGLIRKYVLAYESGDLGKSRLQRIAVQGTGEQPFHAHEFGYENRAPDADGVTLFGPPVPWVSAAPSDTGLSGSREWGFGFHGFVGLGMGPAKEAGTVGVGFGYGRRNSRTELAFIDLNGDGLPDRVYDGSGAAGDAVLFNQGDGRSLGADVPAGDPGASLPGVGLDFLNRKLGRETGNSFDASLQAFWGIAALNFGANYSLSNSEDFALDANGDGLVDLVNSGKVYFNQPRAPSCAPGATQRECCPAGGFCFLDSLPMQALQDLGDSSELVNADGSLARANQTMDEALTPEDAVLEWTAPYDGSVDVSGTLAFAASTSAGDRGDGVRLRIYHYNPFETDRPSLQHTYLKTPGDASATPVLLPRVPVKRGEILYFVLSTLSDFPMNDRFGKVSPVELVDFAPVVTYLGVVDRDRDLPDPSGAGLFRFDSKADFALAGNPQGSVTLPRDGNVAVTLKVNKQRTSDSVRLCVQYAPPSADGAPTASSAPCRSGDAFYVEYAPDALVSETTPIVKTIPVAAGGTLFFRIDTHLAIDPRKMAVKASGVYSCVDSPCVAPAPADTPRLSFTAVPYVRLHEPVEGGSSIWKPWGAPLTPFRVTTPGTLVIQTSAVNANRDVPIYFSVRTADRQLFKVEGNHWDINPEDGSILQQVHSFHLDAGEVVFIEAHSESAQSTGDVGGDRPEWNLSCLFRHDQGSRSEACTGFARMTTDRNADGWSGGNHPLLSGGFHGWRYGAWNGKESEPFEGWVFRGPAEPPAGDWEGTAEEVGRRQKDKMKNENDPQRVRLRLLGLLVPSMTGTKLYPDQEGFETSGSAFVSQDGNTYFTAGQMHAGKKGQSASIIEKDPDGVAAQPLEFRIGKIGRTSASVGVSAGLSLFGIVGGGLSSGLTQQKVDVTDMNGDGMLDVVAAGGIPDIADLDFGALVDLLEGDVHTDVRVTSPVSLGTARKLRMPGLPNLTYDLSGQVNLGVSSPIPELKVKGEKRALVARFPGFGGGVAFNVGTVVQQLVDMNGDGLPDVVRRSDASCPGGFAVRLNLGTSFAANEDCVDAPAFAADGILATVTAGGDDGDSDTARSKEIVSGMRGLDSVRRSTTLTLQGTSGADLMRSFFDLAGGITSTESYGVSVAAETSINATNEALVDVTGDGLPDYVHKANTGNDFVVRVNRGYGFAPARTWHPAASWVNPAQCPPGASSCTVKKPRLHLALPRAARNIVDAFIPELGSGIDPIEATGSHSVVPNVSVAFNFAWPVAGVLPVPPWLHIGAGFSVSPEKISGFELGLQDIDGDGLVDHVLKTADNAPVWARLNQLGKANLLKHVSRPLGGGIDLAYEQRVGNTVDMPESRWVLTSVTVRDGRAPVPGATGHDLTTRFAYDGGKRDRYEREFLGFAKVTRTNPDDSTVEQEYKTTILEKGLLVAERMRDPGQRLWSETINTWSDPIPVTGAAQGCLAAKPVLLNPDSYCRAFFTKLSAVEKKFYEGEPKPGIGTRQEFEYDGKGDVATFRDLGDVADATDDLFATILYASDAAAANLYSVSRPSSVDVRDRNGLQLRYRSASYDSRGNLEHFEAPLGDGRSAKTDLRWYPNGTLEWIEGPENASAQRYKTTYAYDGVAGTHITSIVDSHGYASSADYDLRFGEAIATTDVNGNVTARRFDPFGRLEALAGPYDSLDHPTVSITYAPHADAPYAHTRNRLPRSAGDTRGTVDTVVVLDGLGRVIQTKKTAEIATSSSTKAVGWSVTGHQSFDLMGRVDLQGQAFASFSSRPEFVPGQPRNPTRFIYDVLGRTLETLEPNGAVTRVAYGFGTAAGTNLRRFKTTTWDAEGHSKVAYRDASDRVVAVEERIDGRTPTTHYQYNPLGEITKIIDAAGNTTRIQYDLLGRRTKLVNPDAGEIRFHLDPAGNVVRKYDPNLANAGSFIEYVYHFDQLREVRYPKGRDVRYTYGTTAGHRQQNGLARVVEVSDDAGRELRSYGKLGELISTTRVLRPILPGDRERSFTTSFSFDSFGRMMTITYPDGETVEYGYDAGGLLQSAIGKRRTGTALESEPYLVSMTYDEFGQRVRMALGNGVVTTYSYQPLTRRLHTLTTRTPLARTLQAITYGYDLVGNIRTMVNALGEPVGDRSGEVRFEYRYDDLYRLKWAHGEAKSRPHTIDRFTAQYSYSDIHNMQSNVQVHEIVHGGAVGVGVERPPKTNHEFGYEYAGSGPHQATKIGDTFLVYDGNGNTISECRDHGDPTCGTSSDHLRRYFWTEENRLDRVIDGGGRNVTRFVYDAAGERIVKFGRGGESITIGQFWSLKGRRAATKHVFAGSTRLASKLLPPPGWNDVPRDTLTSTVAASTPPVGNGVPNENGCDPSNYNPLKCPALPGGEPSINHYYDDTKVRPETYYYHPDHLGSTSWVTDQNARVHEHVEYFPYGEVWRDPRSDADGGPVKGQRFLFTGKEFDEETGLVYFGARYYEPKRALWKSSDPILEEYLPSGSPRDDLLPGLGGAFNPANFSMYSYAHLNPVRYMDPDGNSVDSALALISEHRDTIKTAAARHGVSAQAIASIIFQEKFKGFGAALKNAPARLHAEWFSSPKANERSFGLAEMQVQLAAKLLGLDVSKPEERDKAIATMKNDAGAIDLIARELAMYQSEFGVSLDVKAATIAHNAGRAGLKSFLEGKVSDEKAKGKVYSRSWPFQKQIREALNPPPPPSKSQRPPGTKETTQ